MTLSRCKKGETCHQQDGDALRRIGDFKGAEQAYRAQLTRNDLDARDWRGLSAIMHRIGKTEEARVMIEHAARLRPVEHHGSNMIDRPRLLRPRSIDAADYRIVKDRAGGFKTRYKGGHFSTANLLSRSDYNIIVANLVGEDPGPLFSAPAGDLFLNTVACADRGRGALGAVRTFLDAHPDMPVINSPDAVARTNRDGNYQRLGMIDGVVFPRTLRLLIDAPPSAIMERIALLQMDLPLIVRATGRQTGRQTYLCRSASELESGLRRLANVDEIYVIKFHDLRSPRGMYNKGRVFFIDGQIYPVAWLTSDHWQIHSGDRYRVMPHMPATLEAERAFLSDPEYTLGPRAWAALNTLSKELGLDFAGVDFALTAAGSLFVFEANAAMRHNFDHVDAFPHTRQHLNNVSTAFRKMIEGRLSLGRLFI